MLKLDPEYADSLQKREAERKATEMRAKGEILAAAMKKHFREHSGDDAGGDDRPDQLDAHVTHHDH